MKEKLQFIWENEKIQKFVSENKDMLIKVAAAAVLVVVAFFVFVVANENEEEILAEEKPAIEETEETLPMIMVDIGGEVKNPMVVKLEEGSRVEDAIKAAGGITENADLTDVNRAAFLVDGDKILIPSIADQTQSYLGESGSRTYSDDRININTATSDELQQLNGVGPATAEKIIEYRIENGRFSTIDDIKNVSGIGDKTFDKFKDDIKV